MDKYINKKSQDLNIFLAWRRVFGLDCITNDFFLYYEVDSIFSLLSSTSNMCTNKIGSKIK